MRSEMNNRVPLNDLKRNLTGMDAVIADTIAEVVSSGWWLNGRKTMQFSEEFSAYIGSHHFLPVSNGTDALEIALRAVGVEAGDEVITVANAGGYTSVACRLIGAIPVYVDIEESSFLIDLSKVPELISNKTRAVVATHLYGNVVDVAKLRRNIDAAGATGIAIIEDCAQCHGAEYNNQKAGSFGDVSTFSFYPSKNLGAMGDAGGILTSSNSIYDRLKALHQYGWSNRYDIQIPFGRNSRMDEIQAAFLLIGLQNLDRDNLRRREIVRYYEEAAGDRFRMPHVHGQLPVAHLAVGLVEKRQAFREYMDAFGIDTAVHYPIMDCDQSAWKNLPFRSGKLRATRENVEKIVTLPCFPGMTDEEISRVCEALTRYKT
jgi:aminotransferase EvaB